jgi:histidinol-phosphate aminotransferase
MALTVRPGILDIAPYVGGESSLAGQGRVIRLASNEGALGASPQAVEAYRQAAATLHRYPDGGATKLREAIGRRFGLDPAAIVCGAGSDELIGLLTRAYAGPGDEVLYSRHGFLMYAIAARSVGAVPVSAPETDLTADVDALLERVGPRTRIVFLANPNNPTGSYLPAAALRRLHEGLPPDVLLVIDAAYAEYVGRGDYEPGSALVAAHDNVVMTRTFSKIFGLAALRLGWAYCPPAVADVLNRLRGPFNVPAPAQAAGVAALADTGHVERARAHNDRWLPWFRDALADIGIASNPSVGNFVLVRFPAEPGADAASACAFLNARGIIPRRMGAYGLDDWLRITIGLEEEMRAVVDALTAFADQGSLSTVQGRGGR